MNDFSDFDDLREASKAKRSQNRELSRARLEREGITFERKNNDAHLIVYGAKITVDFWPGTGKWIARDGTQGRGVAGLVTFVKGE